MVWLYLWLIPGLPDQWRTLYPCIYIYDSKYLWLLTNWNYTLLWTNKSVKVTYLGIRSAHERVWLVERKPIWLPRAYLTRGDLEPATGNLHVCKFLRELTNIQIRTVTAERKLCSECICPTNVWQLNEGSTGRKEGRKAGRREPEGERERRKEGELGRKRERRNS